MDIDKIKELLEQEGKLLAAAVARTMQAYNQSGTVADLRNYQAAKKAYEDFQRRQAAILDPDSMAFRTQSEVYEYLKEEGYKISRGALSEKWFAVPKQKDGSVLKKDVDAFAKRFLRKADGSDEEIDISEKLAAEVRKLTAEAEKKELEVARLRGELVERHEVEHQLADRAAFLKNSLIEFFHSLTPRFIEIAGGDIQRTPEVVEFCLMELEKLMDHYSRPLTFRVPVYNGNGGKNGDNEHAD